MKESIPLNDKSTYTDISTQMGMMSDYSSRCKSRLRERGGKRAGFGFPGFRKYPPEKAVGK